MAQKTCGEAGVSLIQNERASRLWWSGRSPQTFMDLLRMNTAGYSVPLALPIVPLSVVTCFGSEWNVLAAGPGWIMVAFCTRNQMPSGKTVAFQWLPLFILCCIVFFTLHPNSLEWEVKWKWLCLQCEHCTSLSRTGNNPNVLSSCFTRYSMLCALFVIKQRVRGQLWMQYILDQSLWEPMRTSRKDKWDSRKCYIQKVRVVQLEHLQFNLCRLHHQHAAQNTAPRKREASSFKICCFGSVPYSLSWQHVASAAEICGGIRNIRFSCTLEVYQHAFF